MTYHAQCSCGAVQIEADGAPVVQCYCHCKSCRSMTGAPLNAITLWPRTNIRITKGQDLVQRYSRRGGSEGGRLTCAACHGLVGAELSGMGLFDVFAGLFTDFAFEPTLHINYENTVLPIRDGLPKFRDMPKEAGGSGQLMEE